MTACGSAKAIRYLKVPPKFAGDALLPVVARMLRTDTKPSSGNLGCKAPAAGLRILKMKADNCKQFPRQH